MYVTEMGLGAKIYIPSFINIGSAIRKLIWGEGGREGIQTPWRSHNLHFLQNKENGLLHKHVCM
jgi:hypothetical protein